MADRHLARDATPTKTGAVQGKTPRQAGKPGATASRSELDSLPPDQQEQPPPAEVSPRPTSREPEAQNMSPVTEETPQQGIQWTSPLPARPPSPREPAPRGHCWLRVDNSGMETGESGISPISTIVTSWKFWSTPRQSGTRTRTLRASRPWSTRLSVLPPYDDRPVRWHPECSLMARHPPRKHPPPLPEHPIGHRAQRQT